MEAVIQFWTEHGSDLAKAPDSKGAVQDIVNGMEPGEKKDYVTAIGKMTKNDLKKECVRFSVQAPNKGRRSKRIVLEELTALFS